MLIKCLNPRCSHTSMTHAMRSVPVYRRGERNGFMCRDCAVTLWGYCDENDLRVGKVSTDHLTYSIELETMRPSDKARVELFLDGYLPTSDCTVDVEFKSPIYQSLNSLMKHLETIGHLKCDRELVIDHNCGTHFHVGHADYINHQTMQYVRRFYHSLFVPLCDEMRANPQATAELFGRNFCTWAEPITNRTSPTNHSNFINTEHAYTLEWRICFFRDAQQYANAVRFCKEATACICTNFIAHFNDENADTEYRKHKADVTARKLVKLYKKYAGV